MNSFTVPTFIAPRFFSPFYLFLEKKKKLCWKRDLSESRESIVSFFFLLIFTKEEEELFDFLSTVVCQRPIVWISNKNTLVISR